MSMSRVCKSLRPGNTCSRFFDITRTRTMSKSTWLLGLTVSGQCVTHADRIVPQSGPWFLDGNTCRDVQVGMLAIEGNAFAVISTQLMEQSGRGNSLMMMDKLGAAGDKPGVQAVRQASELVQLASNAEYADHAWRRLCGDPRPRWQTHIGGTQP